VAEKGPWKSGDTVRPAAAPRIAGKALEISAEIEAANADGVVVANGVIVAQGGNANGYTLFLKDRRLAFGVREAKNLTVVTASEPLRAGHVKVEAQLTEGGDIKLLVDGKTVATGHAPGLIPTQPARGLFVGRDAAPVADYTAPNEFDGKIENVNVRFP
jgi:hypothetical protein